ncbi:MAG: glycosyltransferase family 2 protein [Halobacteriovoraceae bacterium]|nr:glycosyltransferase family 2 protein [Halobacteriovoraceae bacterium]MCB9094145.1 glycosyltransferase family 2 protein [Halobacteriovoraceae bacterium]
MLSVIIITKNEEKNIEKCLASVAWCDEIIVYDSGSSDKTLEIAKKFTDKIYSDSQWPGFGVQKQRALDKASMPWVLSLDADEIVSENLKIEIKEVISKNEIEGYYIPRLSHIADQPVKHSGWYPDYIIRLFKKDSARFSDSPVHEKVLISGETQKLKNPLLHFPYPRVEMLVNKLNQYSTIGAAEANAAGKKVCFMGVILRMKLAFIKHYFLKLGFLDGQVGFIVAMSAAETTYYKYLKLYYLNKE